MKLPLVPAARGRPSTFTQAKADAVCELLAQGKSLRTVCEMEGMPQQGQVFRWLDDHESFREQYARARDKGLDVMAEELLHIADTPKLGVKTVDKPTGVEISEGDMLEHRKLQIDTRKWYLSKLAPKRYGDRLNVDAKVEFDLGERLTKAIEARRK